MNNQFSYQQKIAMMRILLDIINADGIVDARETFYFNELIKEFELEKESLIDVREKNSLLALLQVKYFDEEQKNCFATLMNKMIVVDDDVNINEVEIYEVVCEFAGIKRSFADIEQ